jgi:transcriptional regulator with XRE-family HTH domain
MDLNQTEYGQRFGVNQVTVSNWENGVFTPHHEHMELLRAAGFNPSETDITGEPVQLNLPFEQNLLVELRIGPHTATGSIGITLRLRRTVN